MYYLQKPVTCSKSLIYVTKVNIYVNKHVSAPKMKSPRVIVHEQDSQNTVKHESVSLSLTITDHYNSSPTNWILCCISWMLFMYLISTPQVSKWDIYCKGVENNRKETGQYSHLQPLRKNGNIILHTTSSLYEPSHFTVYSYISWDWWL